MWNIDFFSMSIILRVLIVNRHQPARNLRSDSALKAEIKYPMYVPLRTIFQPYICECNRVRKYCTTTTKINDECTSCSNLGLHTGTLLHWRVHTHTCNTRHCSSPPREGPVSIRYLLLVVSLSSFTVGAARALLSTHKTLRTQNMYQKSSTGYEITESALEWSLSLFAGNCIGL